MLSVDASNKDAKEGLSTAQYKHKLSVDKDKKIYAGMFNKFAKADAKVCSILQLCSSLSIVTGNLFFVGIGCCIWFTPFFLEDIVAKKNPSRTRLLVKVVFEWNFSLYKLGIWEIYEKFLYESSFAHTVFDLTIIVIILSSMC